MRKIILLSGDPNSINSEIIFKCWNKISKSRRKNIFLISNYNLLKAQFKKLKYKIKLTKVSKNLEAKNLNDLKIINVELSFKKPFQVSKENSSKFVLQSLNLAHNLALKNNVIGIINCPINKNLLKKKNRGVTEYLASKCRVKKDSEVMLIHNKKLIVSPITIHADLKSVSKKIKEKLLITKITSINKWFKKLNKRRPKIGVLGLNPHNAELRKDSEEKKIILPTINKLKKRNILVKGPLVADTTFINDYKSYDVIVGMYHDQVLTPFKTLFKFNAINQTLGLKYKRVSPDHGVASDKILLKKSDHTSLLECINYISSFNK